MEWFWTQLMSQLPLIKDNLRLVKALKHSCVWRKDDSIHHKHTLYLWGRTLSPHVAFVDTASCLADQDQGSIHCGTLVLWLAPGCRSSFNDLCLSFVQPPTDRENTWEWESTWAVELMAKHIILEWPFVLVFSHCMWWGAMITVKESLVWHIC